MLILITVLRLLHIVSGIFWVGAALMLTFFITPAVRATDEAGQKFLTHFMRRTPINQAIIGSSLLSVAAGMSLYWIDSNGFQSPWMHSGPGIGFGLGGVAGLLGLYFGIQLNRRSRAMMQLGQQIQNQGAPPTPEQLAAVQKLQAQLKSGGMLNAVFLLLAAILMSTARFWVF